MFFGQVRFHRFWSMRPQPTRQRWVFEGRDSCLIVKAIRMGGSGLGTVGLGGQVGWTPLLDMFLDKRAKCLPTIFKTYDR